MRMKGTQSRLVQLGHSYCAAPVRDVMRVRPLSFFVSASQMLGSFQIPAANASSYCKEDLNTHVLQDLNNGGQVSRAFLQNEILF